MNRIKTRIIASNRWKPLESLTGTNFGKQTRFKENQNYYFWFFSIFFSNNFSSLVRFQGGFYHFFHLNSGWVRAQICLTLLRFSLFFLSHISCHISPISCKKIRGRRSMTKYWEEIRIIQCCWWKLAEPMGEWN